MRKSLALRCVVGAALLSFVTAMADAASPPFDAGQRDVALQQIETAIRTTYVVTALREPIVARLEASRREGRYDGVDAGLFASRVTEDLRAASSNDRHLYLNPDPRGYDALRAAKPIADDDAFDRRQAIRGHHGLSDLRLLPGNVRYLRIRSFDWVPDVTGQAYDDAMRFLRDGDAIVIDLRGNGGGEPAAVRYLVSHFVDDDSLLLTFVQSGKPPVQSRALGYLPAGRLKGKPLYVLIDGRAASAAEEFAYHVEQFRLGTLVGATTAGAAHDNQLVAVAPLFVLSVSTSTPEHAVSGTNWEGKGIAPTVPVAPERALDVAYALALERIAATPDASADAKADARWALVAAHARVAPPTVTRETLAAYAGQYDRITLVIRDGTLWMDRGPRGATRLVPLTNDGLFGIEGDDDQRLRATGTTIELQRAGGAAPLVLRRGAPVVPR